MPSSECISTTLPLAGHIICSLTRNANTEHLTSGHPAEAVCFGQDLE